jgi:hypothetical protein
METSRQYIIPLATSFFYFTGKDSETTSKQNVASQGSGITIKRNDTGGDTVT